MSNSVLLDSSISLKEECGDLVIKREQHIPQSYLDHLADQRLNSMATPEGELFRVASIPTALVDDWKRKGFDIYTATPAEIVSKLRNEGFDNFVTTRKRVG